MKSYRVTAFQIYFGSFHVLANSEAGARALASDKLDNLGMSAYTENVHNEREVTTVLEENKQ